MNITTLMLTPWRARNRGWHWLAIVIAVLAFGGAIAAKLFLHRADWWFASIFSLGVGEAALWASVFPSTLLLAVDARQLRLPGMLRCAVVSLLVYALLSVLLPAGLLGLAGAPLGIVTLLLVLCCLGGLLFQLLPRFVASMIGFMPMVLQTLPGRLSLPGPTTAGFTAWAVPAALLLLLAVIVRGYQLLHDGQPYHRSWGKPLLLQFRHLAGRNVWGGFAGGKMDATRQLHDLPHWLRAGADVRDTGPHRMVRSLRVAMGPLFMPLTAGGRLKQWSFVLVPSLLFVLLMALQKDHDLRAHTLSLWGRSSVFALIWFGAFGSAMLAAMAVTTVQQRWKKINAELPLLALLPGMRNAAQAKRNLLRATLGPPMFVQLMLIVALVLMNVTGAHLGVPGMSLLLLAQIGSSGFLLAGILATIGGRPLSNWALGLLALFGYALICISIFLPATSGRGMQLGMTGNVVLAIAWASLIVALLWLGRRGWRGLQQRPHPFMPNT
jgi:hypothetical protein